MKKILIENTQYSLFLYFLINKELDDTHYIVSSSLGVDVINRLKASGCSVYVFDATLNGNILMKTLKLTKEMLRLFFHSRMLKKKRDIEVFGNDNITHARFFLSNGIKIIEDGIANYREYNPESKTMREKMLRHFTLNSSGYIPFGYDDRVKNVFLTGLMPIPCGLINKVITIDVFELWRQLEERKKQLVLKIFGLENIIISSKPINNVLLLTQPLSEDGYISECDKIEIYRKLISKYSKDKIVLKRHPRELTDYEHYFPDVSVFPSSAPIEIIQCIGGKFNKVVTLFSSAALQFEDASVDFYGTRFDSRLESSFGIINSHFR